MGSHTHTLTQSDNFLSKIMKLTCQSNLLATGRTTVLLLFCIFVIVLVIGYIADCTVSSFTCCCFFNRLSNKQKNHKNQTNHNKILLEMLSELIVYSQNWQNLVDFYRYMMVFWVFDFLTYYGNFESVF